MSETNNLIQNNSVKNPNWLQAKQLAIYLQAWPRI